MNNTRRPYDCTKELQEWKEGKRGYNIVVKMRTFRFLDYPQANPEVFEELYQLTEAWAKENPLQGNPNQEALDVLSDKLVNPEPNTNGCLYKVLFFIGMVVMTIVVALARGCE